MKKHVYGILLCSALLSSYGFACGYDEETWDDWGDALFEIDPNEELILKKNEIKTIKQQLSNYEKNQMERITEKIGYFTQRNSTSVLTESFYLLKPHWNTIELYNKIKRLHRRMNTPSTPIS